MATQKQREIDEQFLEVCFKLAFKSYKEGGCPIGALVVDANTNTILGQGHNNLVQEKNPILHGEMSALRDAGRIFKTHSSEQGRNFTMYTSLSPCAMCSGAIVQAKIRRVVVGDATNCGERNNHEFLKSRGIAVDTVENQKSIELVKAFKEEKPSLWAEDWMA